MSVIHVLICIFLNCLHPLLSKCSSPPAIKDNDHFSQTETKSYSFSESNADDVSFMSDSPRVGVDSGVIFEKIGVSTEEDVFYSVEGVKYENPSAIESHSATSPPIVTIDSGKISGKTGVSTNGRQFYSFEGIPYAKPPVGELRFAEPFPVEPWDGIKTTTKFGNRCLQLTYAPVPEVYKLQGDEDCLFLNVYTPKLPLAEGENHLDVFVFLHGGGNNFGSSSSYKPESLMDEDIVLVTLNYRVGILGFASTGNCVVPGNNGLKDQVLALQWVQRNIRFFGGNSDSVTIGGISAGASDVHYHYLSPLTKGLFHRGISFSGTAIGARHEVRGVPYNTRKVAAALNCPTRCSAEMIACLRRQDGDQLVNMTLILHKWLQNSIFPFGPVVEVNSPTSYISKSPLQVIIDGEAHPLPWIATLVTEEGLFPIADYAACDWCLSELNSDYRRIFPALLDYEFSVKRSKKDLVSDAIRLEYFGDEDINTNNNSVQSLIKMVSDRANFIPTQFSVLLQAKHSSAEVYSYIFGYRGEHSLSEELSNTNVNWGVSHSDDIAYLIHSASMDTTTTVEDRKMGQFLRNMLISYMRSGAPKLPPELGVTWLPQDKNTKSFNYLHILDPETVEMKSAMDIGNFEFWKSLPFNESLHNLFQTQWL